MNSNESKVPLSTMVDPAQTAQFADDPPVLKKPSRAFGTHIESIAHWCGLHPVDVALGIAAVLGNIAGPFAGLVDPAGGRVHPRLSLLSTGAEKSRWRMLEDRLFQPLRKRADWLRQRACSQSRILSDRYAFGNHGDSTDARKKSPAPVWLKRPDEDHGKNQHLVITSQVLPADLFSEHGLMSPAYYPGRDGDFVRRTPGSSHLPSFFFEGIDLSQIKSALNESVHREALLLYPAGGVFNHFKPRVSKETGLAHALTNWMDGSDTRFEPIHADQGHGSFERARVHLWTTLPIEIIGETLHDAESEWREIYKRCLICEPTAWKPSESREHNSARAWQRFDHNVHNLLDRRCFGTIQEQRRLGLDGRAEPRFRHLQNLHLEQLGKLSDPNSNFVSQFHDLPARLLWVFMLLGEKGEPSWKFNAAFDTALYAARKHDELLKRAHQMHTAQLATNATELLISVLRKKGPLKLRDIQRSCNNRRADYFKPVLTLMQQQGRLRIDGEKRLHLIAQS